MVVVPLTPDDCWADVAVPVNSETIRNTDRLNMTNFFIAPSSHLNKVELRSLLFLNVIGNKNEKALLPKPPMPGMGKLGQKGCYIVG